MNIEISVGQPLFPIFARTLDCVSCLRCFDLTDYVSLVNFVVLFGLTSQTWLIDVKHVKNAGERTNTECDQAQVSELKDVVIQYIE